MQHTDFDDVGLDCQMTISNPPVHSVRWYRDGDVIANNPVSQSEDLTVKTMPINQFGDYMCEAVTDRGAISSNLISYKKQCE